MKAGPLHLWVGLKELVHCIVTSLWNEIYLLTNRAILHSVSVASGQNAKN